MQFRSSLNDVINITECSRPGFVSIQTFIQFQQLRELQPSNMRRLIAIVSILSVLSFSPICQAFDIEDCGSKVGKFTSINLSCDMGKRVCDLIPGTNATIAVDFTVDKDVSKITAVVHGILMDIPIPFPLTNAYPCNDPESGITCPLTSGGSYHYRNTLPVHRSYPKVSCTVKWQLKDENNEDIICMLIPAKII